ncbi:hypothetical protein AB9F47_21335 [Rhizobium leguminosarum]
MCSRAASSFSGRSWMSATELANSPDTFSTSGATPRFEAKCAWCKLLAAGSPSMPEAISFSSNWKSATLKSPAAERLPMRYEILSALMSPISNIKGKTY